MGSYGVYKQDGQSLLDFFRGEMECNTDTYKVVIMGCSVVKLRTAYLAICRYDKILKRAITHAEVVLLTYPKNDMWVNLIYKPIDEFMGPNETECPEKILKMLTPIDQIMGFDGISEQGRRWAQEWRDACWEKVRRGKEAKKVNVGVGFAFTYGGRMYTITDERNKQSWRLNGYYKMGKARLRKCLANGQAVEVKCT